MRTAAEWESELASRAARWRLARAPWLRRLLAELVLAAGVELRRARDAARAS